jgi:hypothetical protein
MKTQANKFQKNETRNNSIMILLMVICGIVLMATALSKAKATHEVNTTDDNFTVLSPIEARFVPGCITNLELDKLRVFISQNNRMTLKYAVNDLSNVEEPEMMLEDISSITAFQMQYFNEKNDQPFVRPENEYLNKLYAQKNEAIFAQIESESHLKELLVSENDKALNVEGWMTKTAVSPSNNQKNNDFEVFLDNLLAEKMQAVDREIEMNEIVKDFLALDSEDEPLNMEDIYLEDISPAPGDTKISENRYLSGLLAAKNEAVFKAIEFEQKCKEFLVLTEEEPLQLEDWMVDEKCWCPKKSHKNYLYTEPYAMNNNK